MRPSAALALVLLALAACNPAPATANFAWQGTLDENGWVRIRNGTGRIEVRRSPDERVAVGAEVRTGGQPVTWVRDSSSEGVTFCVVFARDARDCERAGRTSQRFSLARWVARLVAGGKRGQPSVRYVLYVPASAGVDVRSINGDVDLRSVVREFRAHTVNGGITMVAMTGAVDVETVNGSVDARLDLSRGDGAVSLETVNGNVTAELAASLDGEVELSTVNGSARSEFALEGEGRRKRHGTLGAGGRRVSLKTVNGSVTLKRRG